MKTLFVLAVMMASVSFADEAQEVFPNLVIGEKNGTYSDGTPKYQSIDYIQIISVLTSAVQELYNEVNTIKNNQNDDNQNLKRVNEKLDKLNSFLSTKYSDFN